MPRNMSFALTTPQFLDRSKTVTRRFGWRFLKPGDIVCGVRKAMGLKPGEKIQRLGLIEIVSVRVEPLDAITGADCVREGFPQWADAPERFVDMLVEHYGCARNAPINRIEFAYRAEAE